MNLLSPVKSGWLTRGEIRDIKKIKTAKGYIYVVARNNDSFYFFNQHNIKKPGSKF